jgi:HSP20 family protein
MANIVRREGRELTRPRGQEWWDPFRLMDTLIRWDPFNEGGGGLFRRADTFLPRFDVKETKEGYLIQADLPGVKEDDLEVSVAGNVLNVSGSREEEQKQEDERYFTMERSYGQFTRAFTLPEGIDPESIRADLKDGVLVIGLKKKPDLQAKKISIGKGQSTSKS